MAERQHRAPPGAEETESPPFMATILYHADGRQAVVTSAAEHDALWHEGGWADSPAAHGVITAPNAQQMARIPRLPVRTPGQAAEERDVALQHLLLEWQQKIDAFEKRGIALEQQYRPLQARLDAVEKEQTTQKAVQRDLAQAMLAMQEAHRSQGREEEPSGEERRPRDDKGHFISRREPRQD